VSKVFPWYSVSESVIEASSEDVLSRAPLNKKLTDAMKAGTLKIYDKNVALLPQTADIDHSHYLNPIEVNKWLSLNDFPYHWKPVVKLTRQTLNDRKLSGELKEAALLVVNSLRADGTPAHQINKCSVSKKIANMAAWSYLSASTIERSIEAEWWRKA
jgi:hypothetical protein|tara:strand:+ start:1294 stop:1767 length:474 start_codon:yes stop_codon:yes gene_type:complete